MHIPCWIASMALYLVQWSSYTEKMELSLWILIFCPGKLVTKLFSLFSASLCHRLHYLWLLDKLQLKGFRQFLSKDTLQSLDLMWSVWRWSLMVSRRAMTLWTNTFSALRKLEISYPLWESILMMKKFFILYSKVFLLSSLIFIVYAYKEWSRFFCWVTCSSFHWRRTHQESTRLVQRDFSNGYDSK